MKASHKQNVFQKLLWFSIYIYIFLFTRMKELVWTRTNWIWLNAKSLRINMFQTNTEKWVNFSVTVSLCIDVYRNARLRTSTNLYIISLAISDIINAVIVMPLLWVSLLQVNGLLVRQSAISTPSSPCFLFTYPQPRWDWRPSTDTSASLSLKTTHESSLILDQKYISLQFGCLLRGTFQFPRWQAWLNIASSLDTPLASLNNPP